MYSPEEPRRIGASIAYFLADVGGVPPELATTLPLFVWDTERLRGYPAPVAPVELATLRRFPDAPVWRRPGGPPFTLRPTEVAARPDLHPRPHARARAADLRAPIDILCLPGGWRPADGDHRLLKASLLGAPTIRAHLVPAAARPAILADLATRPPRYPPASRGACVRTGRRSSG